MDSKIVLPNGDLNLEMNNHSQGNPISLLPFVNNQDTFQSLLERANPRDYLDIILFTIEVERSDLLLVAVHHYDLSQVPIPIRMKLILKVISYLPAISHSRFQEFFEVIQPKKISKNNFLRILKASIKAGNSQAARFMLNQRRKKTRVDGNQGHGYFDLLKGSFLSRATREHFSHPLGDRESRLFDLYQLILTDPQTKPPIDFNLVSDIAFNRYIPPSIFKLFLGDQGIPLKTNILRFEFEIILNTSISIGNYEMVKYLVQEMGIRNDDDIILAADEGHVKIVLFFLREGMDPSVYDNQAIQWASEEGNLEVVRLLLTDPRVDPSAKNNLALKLTLEENHPKVVKLLLDDSRVREVKGKLNPHREINRRIKIAIRKGDDELRIVLEGYIRYLEQFSS